jgi:membrane-bound metal-dependent hydrolase YbcI (DUF457 family)
MASYRGHLLFSSALGAGLGGFAVVNRNYDWGRAFLGAGLTTLGGLLPDLDSDSGVPVRELFGAAATVVPLLLIHRFRDGGYDAEQILVLMGMTYVFVRYGLSLLFKRLTVHRGMFHSIPALLISGLAVYLLYHSPNQPLRVFLAGSTMLGFLSHLVLDELFSVDLMGARVRFNKYAGSALKLASASWKGTLTAYLILAALGFLALQE